MGRKLTQEEFLEKAINKHGDKYDFSKSVYIHSKQKLSVFCITHQKDFYVSPNHLLKGSGCPYCGGTKKLTQAEFIRKAIEIHGEKYDYSLVHYKNYDTPVKIICKEHGIFSQKPHAHLNGHGCNICGGSNPYSTEDFITSAKKVHGNKYDYSKVDYNNTKSKVEIICKKHGSFWQSAEGHLNGYGCKKCSGNYIPLTVEFIIKAKEIHNDLYLYDKVNYLSAHKPVTITCKFHGDFQQTPHTHLKGSGCYLCSILKKKNPNSLPKSKSLTEDFIRKARIKHGNKYDYTKVEYINNKSKILIKCPVHGWTEQIPNSHLKGLGCPQCSNEETAKKNRKGKGFFITKAREIHGNKYSYTTTIITSMRNKTKIICKKHGEFEQAAYAHLRGQGCPKCKESNGERIIRVFFERNKIKYIYQKKFEKCKNQSYLFFDFYLPKYNLLIEYDGEQHFKTTRGKTFGGQKGFEKRKLNDQIKDGFALKEGIRLLRINYNQMKEIESILVENLKKQIPLLTIADL